MAGMRFVQRPAVMDGAGYAGVNETGVGPCSDAPSMLGAPSGLVVTRRGTIAAVMVVLWMAAAGCVLWAADSTAKPSAAGQVQEWIQAGKLAEARHWLQTRLASPSGDGTLWNLLGVVEAQLGDADAAEKAFRKALTHAPGSVPVLLNLARLRQEQAARSAAALPRAVATYRQVLQREPGHVEATYQLAFLLMRQGECAPSLTHLRRLAPALRSRSQAMAIAVACEAASDETALSNHPQLSERDVLDILPTLARSRREAIAVRLLESLHSRGLAGVAGLRALAGAYEHGNQPQQARRTWELVAQREGASVPLLLALARNAYAQQDYEGTLGYLAHAREREPNNAAVHFFFGMTAVALDLVYEARSSLGKAVELEPNNAPYHFACGAVAASARDVSASFPHFEAYRRLRPDDARGQLALAIARYLNGEFAVAEQGLRALAERPDTAAGAHHFLGRLAKEQNRPEEAERHLTRSLALLDLPDTRAELGQLLIRLGRLPDAERQLNAALQQEPGHYLATLQLLVLYRRTKDERATPLASQFESLKEKRAAKEQLLWRTIQVRPY